CFFFFSSRRRHMRSKHDWSSDVCSSDLSHILFIPFLLFTILNRELAKGFLILNYLPKEVYKLENIDDLWNYILSELESKMSKPSYDTWLSNTYVKDFSNDILTISVENDFIKNWLV